MQPTAQIDMDLIREAIQRRMQSGAGTPQTEQMTTPGAILPTQAPNTPTNLPSPQPTQTNVMSQNPVSSEARAVMGAKSGSLAGLDEDTRNTARALAMKLIKAL